MSQQSILKCYPFSVQTVVYQLRSGENHRCFSSWDGFAFGPQLCALSFGEADLWVWGLEDLSAANKQTSNDQ